MENQARYYFKYAGFPISVSEGYRIRLSMLYCSLFEFSFTVGLATENNVPIFEMVGLISNIPAPDNINVLYLISFHILFIYSVFAYQ